MMHPLLLPAAAPYARRHPPPAGPAEPYAAVAASLERALTARRFASPIARIGGGTVRELGDYLTEIDRQMSRFDAFVKELEQRPGRDQLSQAFFGGWTALYLTQPWLLDETNGLPYGWLSFLDDQGGFFNRLTSDDPLWAIAEKFEDRLIHFYDLAVEGGARPPFPRPARGYEPPPPEQTTAGQLQAALRWAAVLGLVFGAGYVLHGLGKLRPPAAT